MFPAAGTESAFTTSTVPAIIYTSVWNTVLSTAGYSLQI